MNKVHFSSKTPEWETPQELFDKLQREFLINFDVCATRKNAKTPRYWTKKQDALSQNWDKRAHWINPPYGRDMEKWIKKASQCKTLVIALLPARTDTKWFHDYIYGKTEIRFIKGRLKFGGGQKGSGSAPFPSMIVIFKGK